MTDAHARLAAALIGAPVAAVLVGTAVASLPGPAEAMFAVGFHLVIPLWVALICGLPALRGRTAWAVVTALALPAGLALAIGRIG